ncbi:hypothetical protein [Streptomyces liangshanensis]|uniref:Leucine rich repeat variant n=1 Tax=Streptomyces liangshanensis TaxID=2717324 RepID=A0A6G9H8L9_9ACTN|nr:hypothetical protein [Streptomyces liangshanensis]QIQ06561.1 hypothetical protein HA039_33425 [Streptomyces liangshanensis]
MSEAIPRPVHLGKVVDGLAENPALPSAFVRRLFAHRGGLCNVAKRPDLSGGMIAEIIATDDHWLIHSLALNRSLPQAFRMTLAGHPDPDVRRAVAIAAGGAPRELFERLINDADPRVRECVAQSDHVPVDLRALLAKDPDPKVRAVLAQWWTSAPEPVRRLLLTDPDDSVRAGACATYFRRNPHPVPPADLVPALLADPVTRAGAVRHCALDVATARRLAGDSDDVRAELAEHPDLPPALRDELAQDPNPCVAVRVFARQDTPEQARAAIHARIRDEAPSPTPHQDQLNPQDLDEKALEREFMGEIARSELRTLRLPWVTADPLPYVDSPYACFRASAAMSDRLPPPLVARLLADEESSVRTTMALHARDQVDPETAERIDRTYRPLKRVRWRPADDFPLPVEVLRRLATDRDPRMRQLATRDPDLPVDSARSLAADPDATVRRAAAAHPRLPAADVTRLLSDPSEFVAAAAAANPNLPITAMHQLLALADL